MFWRRKKRKNKRGSDKKNRKNKIKLESMFDEKEIKKLMGSVM